MVMRAGGNQSLNSSASHRHTDFPDSLRNQLTDVPPHADANNVETVINVLSFDIGMPARIMLGYTHIPLVLCCFPDDGRTFFRHFRMKISRLLA